MVDVKRKQGYEITGKIISGYQLYRLDLWNNWDDLALHKSLHRKPNEDNIIFRGRILAAVNYNSTKQGLINWASDSFDASKYNVDGKKIFTSVYSPLSYMAYNKLTNKSEEYYPPRIIIGTTEIIFPEDKIPVDKSSIELPGQYMYNYEKTLVYNGSETWTLWKNVDQTYFPIWESSVAPSELKLRYQLVLDDELFIIEESAKGLTRDDDGNIMEE